jgi:hypothetical protein
VSAGSSTTCNIVDDAGSDSDSDSVTGPFAGRWVGRQRGSQCVRACVQCTLRPTTRGLAHVGCTSPPQTNRWRPAAIMC